MLWRQDAYSGKEAENVVLLLEPFLEGDFIKWNTNNGEVGKDDDPIPQVSMSHTSHSKTERDISKVM